MIYSPLVKALAGSLVCYAAPRAISYVHSNSYRLVSTANHIRLRNFYTELMKIPKSIPYFCQSNAEYLSQNHKLTSRFHLLLFCANLSNATKLDSSDFYTLHALLLPAFWTEVANFAQNTAHFAKYTFAVMHDNQWISHLVFCYFLFNGSYFPMTTNHLMMEYATKTLVGNIAIDILKSVCKQLNLINPYYLQNRIDQYA